MDFQPHLQNFTAETTKRFVGLSMMNLTLSGRVFPLYYNSYKYTELYPWKNSGMLSKHNEH